jgi:alkylation response protein AidB-like acyl-CoA dehydrogenase
MHIGLTAEQEALRDELRAYYAELLTPEVRHELAHSHGVGPAMRRVVKQMGTDRWLGVGWPKEYGGRGLTPAEQFVFFDESMRAGAPVPMLTLNTVGPTIMRFGTDEQKDFFLPKIVNGELHFCIGYSEPGAGTDLANLQTKAIRDGDEYVINGQKLWTSLAGDADYIWLAVRTDPDAQRHRGISLLIVDMKNTPGIIVNPLHLMGEHDINAVFFEDVRVPVTTRVGEEHGGWKLITNQLNNERVTLVSSGVLQRYIDDVTQWASTTDAPGGGGGRVIDQPWVRTALARVHARLEALRLMNWEVASSATEGSLAPGDASAMKVYGSELNIEVIRILQEIVGPAAYLDEDAPGAALAAELDRSARGILILTFGGGTNELQRDLIATFALGFPRMR